MFSSAEITRLLDRLGITHVVTVPDSTIGQWDDAIAGLPGVALVRVCREGEAWAVAAGLHLGGKRPLVLIQCTGLFESGDSLRNALHDWKLPIPSLIGYRSYLNQDTIPGDTCLVFTEPLLDAWKIPYRLVTRRDELEALITHLMRCGEDGVAGAGLIAEGKA